MYLFSRCGVYPRMYFFVDDCFPSLFHVYLVVALHRQMNFVLNSYSTDWLAPHRRNSWEKLFVYTFRTFPSEPHEFPYFELRKLLCFLKSQNTSISSNGFPCPKFLYPASSNLQTAPSRDTWPFCSVVKENFRKMVDELPWCVLVQEHKRGG